MTVVRSANEPPAPGTRPKDRRAITVATAAELFYRRGYQQVSVAEIARATNVGSSAIFRHFPTKSELLVAATRRPLAVIAALLDEAAASELDPAERLPAALPRLAEFALDHRETGVLWQREARVLEGGDQAVVRADMRAISRAFADLLRQQRPDLDAGQAGLLAWCSLGALVSVGFHSAELPREQYVALLVDLVGSVIRLDLPRPGRGAYVPDTVSPEPDSLQAGSQGGSRRDQLLGEATHLFAERGFGAVGVDEIGTAAGIAGPSVYAHFSSKQQLLGAIVERGSQLLRQEADAVLALDTTAALKLDRLVGAWIGLALRDRDLLRLVLSEIRHLDQADRDFARQQQRDYIDTWSGLVVEATGVDPVEARIRVQAVLLVVNDAVQTAHLRQRPDLAPTLHRLSLAVLGLST